MTEVCLEREFLKAPDLWEEHTPDSTFTTMVYVIFIFRIYNFMMGFMMSYYNQNSKHGCLGTSQTFNLLQGSIRSTNKLCLGLSDTIAWQSVQLCVTTKLPVRTDQVSPNSSSFSLSDCKTFMYSPTVINSSIYSGMSALLTPKCKKKQHETV